MAFSCHIWLRLVTVVRLDFGGGGRRRRAVREEPRHLAEIKARSGPVLAITHGDIPSDLVDDVIKVPKSERELDGILLGIPLQMLAYYVAIERGNDVDRVDSVEEGPVVECLLDGWLPVPEVPQSTPRTGTRQNPNAVLRLLAVAAPASPGTPATSSAALSRL